MGTHPIFESDFDCLTEIMFRQIGRHLARRAASAKVTQPAPAFSGQAVVNGSFQEISLEQYTSEGKWVLFFFYPLDFTFVCPTELIAFSDMVSEFADNNCQVVACSVDSHFSHLAWNNMPRNQGGLGGVEYPILADFSKQIAEDYGVLIDAAGGFDTPPSTIFLLAALLKKLSEFYRHSSSSKSTVRSALRTGSLARRLSTLPRLRTISVLLNNLCDYDKLFPVLVQINA